MQPTHKTPREQFDEKLEKEQEKARDNLYNNKSFLLVIKIVAFSAIVFNTFAFIESLIYYDVTAIEVIGMIVITILQAMFFFCFVTEKCFYYFKEAINNYYYQGAMWMAFIASETLFEQLCPAWS